MIQKLKDKAWFVHDALFADCKDLATRTVSDKVLKDRAYEIALNPKYDGYQGRLTGVICTFFG